MNILKCFKGKTVLITGHTGFKGSWLSVWLNQLGAEVIGLSLDVPSQPSNFELLNIKSLITDYRIDIRNSDSVRRIIQEHQPDFVFHLAAQALVLSSYKDPLQTITTNAIGSANVLDALRTLDKFVAVVMITSDKVYKNVDYDWSYRETDGIGGKDPYSASKGMAELVIQSYIESFFNVANSNIRISVARAGNVIGGGDWATDRIIPDCIKAWKNNKRVDIRNPNATRPWQHVLEPLSGYLSLANNLVHSSKSHGEAYNFGPSSNQSFSVSKLIDEMAKHWDKVKWNDISKIQKHLYEAKLLKLNCDKALFDLNWQPTLQFEETVRMTIEWYKMYYQNEKNASMYNFTTTQITEYTNLAKSRCIAWTNGD